MAWGGKTEGRRQSGKARLGCSGDFDWDRDKQRSLGSRGEVDWELGSPSVLRKEPRRTGFNSTLW